MSIAIIALAGRFPGAADIRQFWANIRDGVESITFYSEAELDAAGVAPALRQDPAYVPARAVLEGADRFDAAFFGYSPREAELLDPQHRIFLELCWEAMERAGYVPGRCEAQVGLYAGSGINTYLLNNIWPNRALVEQVGAMEVMIAGDKDFLATRVAYELDLKGPAVSVQTACSTSLVAVHLACQALLSGECDMALAGGSSVRQVHSGGYRYQEGGVLSPDGHCRPFDAGAAGTVFGSGAGVVLLKRLEDALADGDEIQAVIKGSAINNDGAGKVGFTAPSIEGQARVIAEALAVAGVEPESVGYVEAHGTGTPLGDPIELEALTRAFRERTDGRQFCALGSVKANIGHIDSAAGVAALIKAVLVLKHRQIPPMVNFRAPTPAVDWAASPFYVPVALREWSEGSEPRRAGVSSFGIGGTNAHLVLEEAPAPAPAAAPAAEERSAQLLLLSARTPTALEAASRNLADALAAEPALNLADVAYTLQTARRPFPYRRALACTTTADAVRGLRTPAAAPRPASQGRPVAFLFPGQGAQYATMAQGLYAELASFRETVDRCAELLRPHLGLDLRALLADEAQLKATRFTQPALFVVEYALAKLLIDWGIKPTAMLGHSVGEYVAATLAGVFSLADGLRLVAVRGQLIQELPPGVMLAVSLSEQAVLPLLGPGLALAVVNGPASVVVAGAEADVAALKARLAAEAVQCRRLQTSHAFHCHMLEPVLAEFARQVAAVRRGEPAIPFLSNVTGTWITPDEARDPQYWTRHLRQTVRFADGLGHLLAQPALALVEVGPGRTLATLARQRADRQPEQPVVAAMRRGQETSSSDLAALLQGVGQLWAAGVPVNWAAVHGGQPGRRRVELPTYPFERQRFWIDPPAARPTADGAAPPALTAYERPELATAFAAPASDLEQVIAQVWQELLGIDRIGVHDDYFELGGDSMVGARLVARLRELFPVEVPLRILFEAPTVAAMAAAVENLLIARLGELSDEEAARLGHGGDL